MPKRPKKPVAVENLTAKQAKAEYVRLQAEIAAHDRRYHQDDAPTVSDAEYDALRRRYNEIEARFPDLRTLESLSLKVGAAPARGFAKLRPPPPVALARNRFRRGGRARLRRAHPPFPETVRRGADRLLGRAEDRR